MRGWERLVGLATSALVEVGEKLAASGPWLRPIDVVLALPELRPGWTQQDADRVVWSLGQLVVPNLGPLRVVQGARGHAGALAEIESAAHLIERGASELCIVGGVDSYFDERTIEWLQRNGQLALEDIPIGFSPGEAAAFVALMSPTAARATARPSLASLVGACTAQEHQRIKTDTINKGEALTTAVARAAADAGGVEPIDTIYCDINGERYRSEEWGFVALALSHVCRDPTTYELPSAAWGDVGAASGALFVALAVAGWQRSYARGPRALLWAGSEGGLRAAVVLEQPMVRG
ncbi:MAG: hypothetical protein AB1Z98_20980 [Nannocystaceae bacterium]